MRNWLKFSLLVLLPVSTSISFAQSGFTANTFPAGNDSTLRVADFNRDGRRHLLGYGGYYGSDDNGYIYMNDGSGGFKAPVALPQNNTGLILAARIADMNGDNAPDIVACTNLQSSSSSQDYLVIYLNDGTGNFTVGQTTALTYGCNSLAVGDVNLDGKQDVVIAAYTSTSSTSPVNNVFQTFFGDGTGKVGTPVTQQNVDLDVPDSSNDYTNCGIVDITGGNFFLDNQFSLFANSNCRPIGQNNPGNIGTTFLGHGYGDGQYTFTQSHKGFEYLTDGQTVDVNADGEPDATFYSVSGQPYSNLYYAQNAGGGPFTYNQLTEAITDAGAPTPTQFTGDGVGDLTLDGTNDIAAIFNTPVAGDPSGNGPPYVSILAQSPSGSFVESQHWVVDPNMTNAGDLAVADFNGDGKNDIAVLAYNYLTHQTNLYVYTNNGSSNSSCNAPTTANTNIICQPAQGSTVASSPVTVTAASNVSGFTLNRLYLDNVSVYQTTSQTVNTPITASNGNHTLVLVSYNNSGQAFDYTTTFTVGSNGSCNAPTTANTNIICQPAQGSTVASSPVTVTAASNVSGFTLNRLYLDNVSVYQTTSQTVNTPITASNGNHTLVLVSYNNSGQAFDYTTTFTVGSSSGCLPSAPGVNICQPASGATENSPVTFTAGAVAQAGYITALRFYVDNVAVATAYNSANSTSFQTTQSVAISAGSHNLVTVAYESTGAALTASESFTVAANTKCYPSTAGAMICSPVPNATVNSPVEVSAGATAAAGYITALGIYVDNVRVNLQPDPYQYQSYSTVQSVSMSSGEHNLVIVGYESTGDAVTAGETVTVP